MKRLAEINKFEVVGNMDETPLYFDVFPGRVIDKKGKKSVVVCTTGNAKRHLTVVLTVLANGEVLPALAIFMGKKRPELHEVGVFILTQAKAWMDGMMMLEWIDLVWEPATKGQWAMSILDSLAAHITPTVKQRLKEINTVPVVIPGGCMSKVQPLEVSLNKPFKSYIRRYWSDYVLEQQVHLQQKQKLKPPTKEEVAGWISSAVDKMQEKPDMKVHSFESCGILSRLNSNVHPDTLLK